MVLLPRSTGRGVALKVCRASPISHQLLINLCHVSLHNTSPMLESISRVRELRTLQMRTLPSLYSMLLIIILMYSHSLRAFYYHQLATISLEIKPWYQVAKLVIATLLFSKSHAFLCTSYARRDPTIIASYAQNENHHDENEEVRSNAINRRRLLRGFAVSSVFRGISDARAVDETTTT